MKYQSELIKEIVDTGGHKKSSIHYQSECVETWIEEDKGAYPKLCDYESEWLNYISILDNIGGSEEPEPPIGEFPYITLTDVTETTVDNVVPYAYKSAILSGMTLVNRKKDNVVISPELSNCYDYTLSGCKSNANYLIKFSAEHDEDVMLGFLIDTSAWSTTELKWVKPGNITVIINSGSTPNYLRIRAKSCENLMIIEYQDDMENWDIPYFEGMQSVKMPVLTTSNEDGTKTNILTVNEDVTLRSNGDVYDELNLLTGRLTQRIDENNAVLAQAVVKTVDLTVVNQDGESMSKIKPIEGTMHLSTSSDTIPPLFSGEIPVEAITQNLASFIMEE